MAALPMVLLTAARAARGRFEAHRRLARVTLPLWLFVSVTGVVVYLMLYHGPGRP
jgi:putative membrane protein